MAAFAREISFGSGQAAWSIGCAFAALSGILLAPTLGLDAFLLTLLVVQAFGACAVGKFSNLPMTYAGGILVAPWVPWLSVALYTAVAAAWLIPDRRIERVIAPENPRDPSEVL